MMAYTHDVLRAAESYAEAGATGLAWGKLRELTLNDFGELTLSLPNPSYPELSRMLPTMASADVQRNWTGNAGYPLLQQTVNFVRAVRLNYLTITGQPLEGARIMDFGCGYGRIARLMYYFTPPENLYGVDPWEESIRHCREAGMLGHFHLSDYLPQALPFPNDGFDLIYAFSVFTHLSQRATRTALGTLIRYLSPNGVLVITCRPEEYWVAAAIDPASSRSRDEILTEHRNHGFAFVPHMRAPIDGDITYGDTSFTIDWLKREFPGWRIAALDRSLDDPYQIILFLQRSGK